MALHLPCLTQLPAPPKRAQARRLLCGTAQLPAVARPGVGALATGRRRALPTGIRLERGGRATPEGDLYPGTRHKGLVATSFPAALLGSGFEK
jgi:hypothetical protein